MTIAPLAGFSTAVGFRDDPAVSADGGSLQSVWRELRRANAQTGRRAEVETALSAVCRAASADNWDGYGAKAVNFATRRQAERFLDILPATVPAPDIGVDPDGEVSFEWHRAPRLVFSISVGDASELSYAGLFGTATAHGRDQFIDGLPTAVMENLRRLYSEELPRS